MCSFVGWPASVKHEVTAFFVVTRKSMMVTCELYSKYTLKVEPFMAVSVDNIIIDQLISFGYIDINMSIII